MEQVEKKQKYEKEYKVKVVYGNQKLVDCMRKVIRTKTKREMSNNA